MTDQRLVGRTALVTGASSGLGRSFAKSLAATGARVAVAARRISLLQGLVSEIHAEGGQAFAVEMDVSDELSVVQAFANVRAHWASPDVVIANAGISVEGRATEMSAEGWDRILSVNVKGVFLTAREGAKGMIARAKVSAPGGRIILISSILGHVPMPGLSAYCATKAAVEMMGRCLSREWVRKGINVNVVCPGYIETDLNSTWFSSENGKKQIAGFPRNRLISQEDISELIIYLSSNHSNSVTGSIFTIDDGQS